MLGDFQQGVPEGGGIDDMVQIIEYFGILRGPKRNNHFSLFFFQCLGQSGFKLTRPLLLAVLTKSYILNLMHLGRYLAGGRVGRLSVF